MSYVEPSARRSLGQVKAEPKQRKRLRTDTMQCLVISPETDRGDMLGRAAAQGGWEPVVFHDAREAALAANRTVFRFVLVDLDAVQGTAREDLHRFCEQFVGMSNGLLVVCGPEEDPQEEIWARQIGAWLYLPGVANESGVVPLCELASEVTNKLASQQHNSQFTS